MTRLTLLVLVTALLLAGAPATAAAQEGGRPSVRAPAAIVIESTTGDVAYQRNAGARRPIASATKLMTALLTLESVALDDVLTAADYRPAPMESVAGLRAGERLTVRDLLEALLLPSANDAAVTLATGISGSVPEFVKEMNQRARELGLRDTSYANPVGLDARDNRSSARDLVTLATVLRRNEFFRRTVDLPRATIGTGARRRTVLNRNRLVRQVPEVNGVKTGRTTDAGYVLVGSASRNGVTVVSAVLGETSEAARDQDTLALLRYALDRYRRVTAVKRGQELARAKLEYRDEEVQLVAGRTVQRVLRRDQDARVRVIGVPRELDGPLTAGARVGTVEVRVGDRLLESTPLVTATAVEEAGLATRLADMLRRTSTMLLLVVALACTVSLVLLRRRVVRRAGIGSAR